MISRRRVMLNALAGTAGAAALVGAPRRGGQVAGIYNVREHGAAGDGSTPDDGRTIQKVVDMAAAAGGGTVYVPAGVYLSAETIELPGSSDDAPYVGVDLVGDGPSASIITASSDFGAGRYLLSCGDPAASFANGAGRYGKDQYYNGQLEGIGLRGPRTGWAVGTAPCKMHGFAWGAGRQMRNVDIRRFNHGLSIVGDHTILEGVSVHWCYYGVYWPRQSAHLYGDMLFLNVDVGANAMASIGIHNDSRVLTTSFLKCTFSNSPYAILKEGGGPVDGDILHGCAFRETLFEGCGNGFVSEATPPGEERYGVVETAFERCQFSWSPKFRLAGADAGYGFRCKSASGLRIVEPIEPYMIVPGDVALFRIGRIEGFRLEGALGRIVWNCTSASRSMFEPGSVGQDDVGGIQLVGRRDRKLGYPFDCDWEGVVRRVGRGSVSAGDVVEYGAGGGVERGSTDADRVAAGIALQPGSKGRVIPILTRSRNLWTPLGLGLNAWVGKGPRGALVPAQGRAGRLGHVWAGDGKTYAVLDFDTRYQ